MNPELRDRLRRALSGSQARDDEGEFERLGDLLGFSGENKLWAVLDAAVSAILTELEAAGWPATPEVPTSEMVEAGAKVRDPRVQRDINTISTYTAMLRARPKI